MIETSELHLKLNWSFLSKSLVAGIKVKQLFLTKSEAPQAAYSNAEYEVQEANKKIEKEARLSGSLTLASISLCGPLILATRHLVLRLCLVKSNRTLDSYL
jgi:hypothetical protein